MRSVSRLTTCQELRNPAARFAGEEPVDLMAVFEGDGAGNAGPANIANVHQRVILPCESGRVGAAEASRQRTCPCLVHKVSIKWSDVAAGQGLDCSRAQELEGAT